MSGARPTLSWPASFALAALILYPLAISLPVLEIRKLGHVNEVTIWSGAVSLVSDGQVAVGLLVFCCSIVIPFLKLSGLLLLSTDRPWRGEGGLAARRHAHSALNWLGRWGMLDVLLAAILVAAIKLGNWADIHPGPGVFVFAAVVTMSLLASALFNPSPYKFPSTLEGVPGRDRLEPRP